MRIREILHDKGGQVFTVEPGSTVHEAMESMVARKVGSLVVKEGEEILGILTERDILTFATRWPTALVSTPVRDVMTSQVIVGVADDTVECVMGLMTRNRIRHMPVVEDGRLLGIVSIGDLVNAVRCEVELENRYMHDYIAGVVA